jgi:integral membrane protein
MQSLQSPIGRVRLLGMIEGVSFLVLLGIAMPLKYLADQPLAVK